MSAAQSGDDVVWDIMDALCVGDGQEHHLPERGHSVSLLQALSTDLDASAFGSEIDTSWNEASSSDITIPNFPPLSEAMLGSSKADGHARTSGKFASLLT